MKSNENKQTNKQMKKVQPKWYVLLNIYNDSGHTGWKMGTGNVWNTYYLFMSTVNKKTLAPVRRKENIWKFKNH